MEKPKPLEFSVGERQVPEYGPPGGKHGLPDLLKGRPMPPEQPLPADFDTRLHEEIAIKGKAQPAGKAVYEARIEALRKAKKLG